MLSPIHPGLVDLRVMHGFGGCQMPSDLPTLTDLNELALLSPLRLFPLDSDGSRCWMPCERGKEAKCVA